ncbi:MAG: hypothetical protein PVI15_04040 [Chromatiales bacterium]|jgi:hypothetical protein
MSIQRRRDILGRIQAITEDYQQLKTLVELARCELGWSEQDFLPRVRTAPGRGVTPLNPPASAVVGEGL